MTAPGARLQIWLDALHACGCSPKRSGTQWASKCPAHEDDAPSLSLTERGGKVLVKCHAGCAFSEVYAALGLKGRLPAKTGAPTARVEDDEPLRPRRLPTGRHVTLYIYSNADGSKHMAVCRRDDPSKHRKVISQWRPVKGGWIPQGAAKPHPLYRLAGLSKAGPVVVVEGEKCADAVADVWPSVPVTTWVGGASTPTEKNPNPTQKWPATDWEPLTGRDVSLIADADGAGHQAMTTLAAHLHGLGCRVKLMLPPFDKADNDIADWLAADPVAAVERVKVGLRTWAPAGEPEPDPIPPIEDQMREIGREAFDNMIAEAAADLRANRHYRLLGVGKHDGRVHFQVFPSRAMVPLLRTALFERKALAGIAPMDFWARMTGEGVLGPSQVLALGDSLRTEADRMGIFNPSAVLGRGAARLETGEVVWHLGDRLLLADGTETTELDRAGQIFQADAPIPLTDPASDAQMREAAEAIMGYRWATVNDGHRFCGWIAAALVAGALEWRPHIQLVAEASTGKTWLLSHVTERIFGQAAYTLSNVTEAALARGTGSDALPVVLDEAEPDELQIVLRTLRSAAGGAGQRWRASPSGSGIDVQISRFCALLMGTATPRLGRADESRLSPVAFGPPVDDWPAVETRIRGSLRVLGPAVRSRIIRDAPKTVAHADTIAEHERGRGIDSREAAGVGGVDGGLVRVASRSGDGPCGGGERSPQRRGGLSARDSRVDGPDRERRVFVVAAVEFRRSRGREAGPLTRSGCDAMTRIC